MSLLHRYVVRGVISSSFAGIMLFSLIIWAGSLVKEMLEMLANGQLTFEIFFRLSGLLAPWVLVYSLPLGIMTGVLLTMGRLSSQSELTAMRASGVSVFRLSSSIFVLAILGTAACLFTTLYYGPIAKTQFREEKERIINENPLGFILEKTFVEDFPNVVFYVSEKDGPTLRDIWFWELNDERQVKRFLRGEYGFVQYLEEENVLRLTVRNAVGDEPPEGDLENLGQTRVGGWGEYTYPLSLDRLLRRRQYQRRLDHMTFKELLKEQSDLGTQVASLDGEEKADVERKQFEAKMVFHQKFATGFAPLSFVLLAIPMGIRASRKETSANLFLAIGLALGYMVVMIIIGLMVGQPQYRPDLLYWVPNIIYQGLGLWLMFKLDRGAKIKANKDAIATT